MNLLGLVPARSSSKGIKDKNIRIFRGKPLLAHAIECARASGVIHRIILSTDSEEYLEIGRRHGAEAEHLRPAHLATEYTPMVDVIAYELEYVLRKENYRPDVVVLLQPTQPLRQPRHIREALAILEKEKCDSVVSVVEVPKHYAPDFVMKIVKGRLVFYQENVPPLTRRQDAANVYYRDGTVYMFRYDSFVRTHSIYGQVCHPMILDAKESVNLDEEQDWDILKMLHDS